MIRIYFIILLIVAHSPLRMGFNSYEWGGIPQATEWDYLIEAIIQVESEGNPQAIGTKNDVGLLQITPIYVEEVNRILGSEIYFLEDRTNREKSLEMFEVYQSHHNPEKDILRAIELHNPRAGKQYKNKILNEKESLSHPV